MDLLVRETEHIGEAKEERLLYRSAGKSPCAFRTMTSSSFARAAVLRSDFIVKSRGVLAHPTTTSVLNQRWKDAICHLLLLIDSFLVHLYILLRSLRF